MNNTVYCYIAKCFTLLLCYLSCFVRFIFASVSAFSLGCGGHSCIPSLYTYYTISLPRVSPSFLVIGTLRSWTCLDQLSHKKGQALFFRSQFLGFFPVWFWKIWCGFVYIHHRSIMYYWGAEREALTQPSPVGWGEFGEGCFLGQVEWHRASAAFEPREQRRRAHKHLIRQETESDHWLCYNGVP